MARYSVATQKVGAATAGLWLAGFRTPSGKDARVFEVGVFAETAAANIIGLRRTTTAGTGTATTIVPVADDWQSSAAPGCFLDTAYATTNPSATGVFYRRGGIPAAIGAGLIWSFPLGLVLPAANSLQIEQVNATAVTYSIYFAYDE